jgi:hypothetical protein
MEYIVVQFPSGPEFEDGLIYADEFEAYKGDALFVVNIIGSICCTNSSLVSVFLRYSRRDMR